MDEYVSGVPEFQVELYKKELSRLKKMAERYFQYEEEQKEKYMTKTNKEVQKILDKQIVSPNVRSVVQLMSRKLPLVQEKHYFQRC